MVSIKKRYERLLKKEQDVADKIKALQSECIHKDVTKIHKANTGNYDPSADCYWIEFNCPDCGKFWVEDQ